MVKTVTFIHTADLHLGAPFRGLAATSPVWAERMMKAIPQAYQRVIDVALEERVDFVLIAGDVFDGARPSYADYLLFIEGLKRLEAANIYVYVCTGNHDPYIAWQNDYAALPQNAHLFSPDHADFAVFKKNHEALALIGSRSYYTQAWPADQDISQGISRKAAEAAIGQSAPFAIGMIHTGLNLDLTRSPAEPKELMRRGMNYWACGHIHQRMYFPEEHPTIAFSGCPQGRDIKETGERGVLKVTLTEGAPNEVEFIPTAHVVWQRFSVDVSSCTTIAEIQEHITNKEFVLNSTSHCQNMVCRVVLEGKTPLHKELTRAVLSDLRDALNNAYPFFFIDTIINRTQAEQDKDMLRAEGLFPAVYLKALDAQRERPDEALAYLEHEFNERDLLLPRPCVRRLPTLYDGAETLVLDLLNQGVE